MAILDAHGRPIPHTFTEAEYARDKAILKKHSNPKCKKCYGGRGYVGKSVKTGKLLVCKCVDLKGFAKEVGLYMQLAKSGGIRAS